jgi:hypothetical protein
VDDLVDAPSWHGDCLSQSILGDAHRVKELLEKDLSRVDRFVCGSHDVSPLVVVGDLDVDRAGGCPGEADAPLVVDADTVLPFATPVQLLEAIAGRDPQVVDCLRSVEDQQFAVRNPLEVGAELADVIAIPDELGLLVRERLDHSQSITRCVIRDKPLASPATAQSDEDYVQRCDFETPWREPIRASLNALDFLWRRDPERQPHSTAIS